MAETNTNNQENVSSAKGVKGGYIFSAPVGTALPTDIKTKLDPAFKCLGFISEDGYVETVDEDSDDLVDMNGDVMDSTNSNRVETAQLTLAEIKAEYRHPLWKSAGDVALKVGGHGGCDFMMDLRWIYCLKHGLPLDMDVYDLASWCCLGELTERSVTHRSESVDVPDFTRGGWRTAKPLGIVGIDLAKMGGRSV